jgi:hypothetical protein
VNDNENTCDDCGCKRCRCAAIAEIANNVEYVDTSAKLEIGIDGSYVTVRVRFKHDPQQLVHLTLDPNEAHRIGHRLVAIAEIAGRKS